MKNLITLVTCLFFLLPNLQAQDLLTLTGKVIDAKSSKPVAFANIGLPKQGIGTTSGSDGKFSLKIPAKFADQTVRISYIGYQTFRRKASDFEKNGTIKLQQSDVSLTEIVVRADNDGRNIVKTAVNKVPENYPTYPTNVQAFYRESLTDENGDYEYLAEGVLRVYKGSYKSTKEGDVNLLESRKMNLKDPLDTTLNARFSSGHMAAHRFDFVRNREEFINKKYLPAYEYKIESVTTLDDKPVWVIAFGPKADFDEKIKVSGKKKKWWQRIFSSNEEDKYVTARMRGKLYIQQENYAMVRAEFEITKKGQEQYFSYPLYSGSWKGNYYVVNYRKVKDKWHFSDALREGTYTEGELYANEVLITENDGSRGKPIDYKERMRRGGYFALNTQGYNEDFWAEYNTTPLNAKLRESAAQMNNILKANEVFDTEKMREVQVLRDSARLAERLAELEDRELTEEEMQDLAVGEPGATYRREKRVSWKTHYGVGYNFLPSKTQVVSVAYVGGNPVTDIVSAAGGLAKREGEVIHFLDFDILFNNRWFIRFGFGGDFTRQAIHRETNLGVGLNVPLSKGRPFAMRLAVQHSRLRYARRVGRSDNDFGKFKMNGETFNADKIDLYFGSRTHNAKFSAEFMLELNPALRMFVRGSYYLPFAQEERLYLKEREGLFRKKHYTATDDPRFVKTDGKVRPLDADNFSVSMGIEF